MLVDNKEIIITGRLVKTARIELECDDIEDPASFIEELKKSNVEADIFTFCQGITDTKPRYNYYMEWDNAAVLSIQSFDYWREKQIDRNGRRNVKKAKDKGVAVKVVDFDDAFAKGIQQIYNETPIRQNKPFWHYGEDFEAVKQKNSTHLERSDVIGAYYNDELIGFMKLVYGPRTAIIEQILSKIEHRDKAPTNALIAKAVEVCENKKVPYFIYGRWSRGSLADFKRRNGFEKKYFPRYYVPLTLKGKILLKLRLHNGIRQTIPEKIISYLIDLRSCWYSRKSKIQGK